MNPIDLATARRLLDFSGGHDALKPLGEIQLEGAVSLQNHLVDPEVGLAYLADEVGMGKTYIALGVVAMLRYFNPMLRVLFICPSRNVQEKWIREYKSFVRNNVLVAQGRIRTRDGKPAAPYTSCRNVESLIHDAASGYYADFFIGKDSFSIHLDNDKQSWASKLNDLRRLVPAYDWNANINDKQDVKLQYADVLNYILPTFDLVVIDEAHNFKHNFESSDRNQVLSRVLGFRGGISRAKRAMLLSATPYDRDINQLRNQLNMVGKSYLIPEEEDGLDKQAIQKLLKRFMVRRLNTLKINGQYLTRNRYRREWRKGERAEISLDSDEQKLVTALVQKKIGEMLTTQTESPSFQTGLLASFESFAESTRTEPVRFDGDLSDKESTDAKDRHVLGHIVDSYRQSGLGRTLPHPKMDSVVTRLRQSIFEEGKKQIVFVRRVKSVKELKDKLDDEYSEWLKSYILEVLKEYHEPRDMLSSLYEDYLEASRVRDETSVGGEPDGQIEPEIAIPPKNDTFFTWFFRGEALKEVQEKLDGWPTPDAVRIGLTARNQVNIVLFEQNWAEYLCSRLNLDLFSIVDTYAESLSEQANVYVSGRRADDNLELFQACQAAFIQWLIDNEGYKYLQPLLQIVGVHPGKNSDSVISTKILKDQLTTRTLYSVLEEYDGLVAQIDPWKERLFTHLLDGANQDEFLKLFEIHSAMFSFLLRTGHGIVDVYLARLMQGKDNLTSASREQWMRDIAKLLSDQRKKSAFSTYYELERLAAHLELIIKNNIPDILDIPSDEYKRYLSNMLNPVSPIIGASGETGERSPQARKFRMPGYPLALISTDVFQEGEDLHTFCDSVMHYGLSASPVGFEQKSG